MRPKMKMQRKTKKKPTPRVIEANDDVRLISFEPCDLQIEAAADEKTPPTFSVVAYTGGAMRIFAFMDPVVVDLRGLKVERETLPVRLDHDRRQGVGHTTKVSVKAKSITAQGIISRSNSWARDVASSGASGFPWQASIGAAVLKVESVAAGAKAIANGRSFSGPVDIIRASVLKEISFVDSGADPKTSVQIAAEEKEYDMKFEDWLKAKGFDPEAITDEQRASLQAAYDAEQAAPKEPDAKPETGAAAETVQAQATETIADPVAEMRTAAAAEAKRIAAVRRVCAGEHPEIEAKAIEEVWPETKVELEVLRASRPQMPAVHAAGEAQALPRVLEAACMVAGGMEESHVVTTYGDQVVQAAHTRFRRGIGLQELLLEAAWANGYTGRSFRSDVRGVLEAAFSTIDVSGILGNTANKFLLQGFMAVESVWQQIAATRSVRDFKQVTSYRLTGAFEFAEVGPDGELTHGALDEESLTNQVKTYGRMFSITRTDMINDDLGALTAVPSRIGRGAGLKLNTVFWTAFMDNASFFSSGNSNKATGAGTALQITALTQADTLFRDQTDPDSKPLAITPKILLVPTALRVTALQLARDTMVNETTTANKPKPSNNPHAGSFTPVSSAYLANSAFTGYSATAWYLLADPQDLPVIEVAFLNGVQQPTVESADADFNTLGVQMRGYFDFGVEKQEYRGGVMMAGA